MKLKILIGVLIALIALNLATIGGYIYFRFIRNGSPHREWVHHDHNHDHDHHSDLNLTPGQKTHLHKLFLSFINKSRTQLDSIHSLQEATFKLLEQDTIPYDQINANLKTISQLKMQINRNLIDNLVETKSFLSREQQQKFYNAIMQVHPVPPPHPDSSKTPSTPSH